MKPSQQTDQKPAEPQHLQIPELTQALANAILQALHYQNEHKRTSYTHRGRRLMLLQAQHHAFQSAYETARLLKGSIIKHSKNEAQKRARALLQVLREYQGAYWAHKNYPNEENAIALQEATSAMRRKALEIK